MGNVIQFPLGKVSGAELKRRADARIRQERKISSDDPAFIKKRSGDVVFGYIDRHRAAIRRGDKEHIVLFGRALILAHAQTRRGLVELSRYLAIRFENARNGGETYLPDEIHGQPWEPIFFRRLSLKLRKMGSEFPAASKKKKR